MVSVLIVFFIWLSRWAAWEKAFGHYIHANVFLLCVLICCFIYLVTKLKINIFWTMCTSKMCCFRCSAFEKALVHCVQVCILICIFRSSSWGKAFVHSVQAFSPKWVFMCPFRCTSWLNIFKQCVHCTSKWFVS